MTFAGFSDADFDAYLPKKVLSHVYNRERLETKQKLLALGSMVGGQMLGSDRAPLAREASAEHPALWNHKRVECQELFFSRHAQARQEIEGLIDKQRTLASLIDDPTPQRKHIVLVVGIDSKHVEIALKLHSDARIDRDNLERKCSDYFHRERLTTILRSLPEPYRIGVVGGTMHEPKDIDDDTLQALVAELASTGSRLDVARSFPRTDPALGGPTFVDIVLEELKRLLPIFHFIAWTRDNDFVSVRETLKQAAAERRAGGLERGDRVRILRGLLSGQSGTVQEVSERGIKVLVGKMSVKVDGADLTKF